MEEMIEKTAIKQKICRHATPAISTAIARASMPSTMPTDRALPEY